ncbi:hypothetical protein GCM10025734_30160 [Kitasatospora paranensis]
MLGVRHLVVGDRVLKAEHHGDHAAGGLLADVRRQGAAGRRAVQRGAQRGGEHGRLAVQVEGDGLAQEEPTADVVGKVAEVAQIALPGDSVAAGAGWAADAPTAGTYGGARWFRGWGTVRQSSPACGRFAEGWCAWSVGG